MGDPVKIQKIQRAASQTYSVNFPSAFADAIGLEKGERMEWFIENRNCFVLKRVKAAGSHLESRRNQAKANRPRGKLTRTRGKGVSG